jgi:hypothetical protein
MRIMLQAAARVIKCVVSLPTALETEGSGRGKDLHRDAAFYSNLRPLGQRKVCHRYLAAFGA